MIQRTLPPDKPGTYALVLVCKQSGKVQIGRLRSLSLQPGFYLYVGSAFGPGGLLARVKHHQNLSASSHWHIDYLRPKCAVAEAWFTTARGRHEHTWAEAAKRLPGARITLRGFGSSDCGCEGHLFWFKHRPSPNDFRRLVEVEINVHR